LKGLGKAMAPGTAESLKQASKEAFSGGSAVKIQKDVAEEIIGTVTGKMFSPMGKAGGIVDTYASTFTKKYSGYSHKAQGMIEALSKKNADEVANLVKSNPPEIQNLMKQTSSLGIHSDEVLNYIKDNDYKSLKSRIRMSVRDKAEKDLAYAVKDNASEMFVEPKVLDNIFKDAKLDWHEKAAKMIEATNLAYKKINEGRDLKEISNLSKISRLFKGPESNIGGAMEYYTQIGHMAVVRGLGEFDNLIKNATPRRYVGESTLGIGLKRLSFLPEKQADAIRMYTDNLNLDNIRPFAQKMGQVKAEADYDAIAAVKAKLGYDMTYADIVEANKMQSSLRQDLDLKNNWKAGRRDTVNDAVKGFDNFDGTTIYKRTVHLPGEVVENGKRTGYWPRIPTQEFLERRLNKTDIDELQGYIKNGDFSNQQKFFEKHRQTNSVLKDNPADRLRPHEEINGYLRSSLDQDIRVEGNRLMQQTKMSALMPIGKDVSKRNLKAEHEFLNFIDKQFQSVMNPASYEGMGKFGKALYTYASATIPFALSSPRMAGMNMWQHPFAGGHISGYGRSIASTASAMTQFGKQVVMNPKNWNTWQKDMAQGKFDKAMLTGKDALFAKNFNRWAQNQPDWHGMLVDEDHIANLISAGSKNPELVKRAASAIKEAMTFAFKASDGISRHAAFNSSHEVAVKAFKNFEKDIMSGALLDDATAKLVKDTHMTTYQMNDLQHVLKPLRDGIQSGNLKAASEEFTYRFAERAVKQQIFDYSKFGQNFIKSKAKELHPIAGIALTFSSWPMYYHELFTGTLNAWQKGDKEPLLKLIAGGITAYAGISAAMGDPESPRNKSIRNWADKKAGKYGTFAVDYARELPGYAIRRVPGTSYIGLGERIIQSPAGILTPPTGLALYSVFNGLSEATKAISGYEGADYSKFSLDFTKRAAKGDVIYRKIHQISSDLKAVGIWDKDLKDIEREGF
jgi:hypothetical protein